MKKSMVVVFLITVWMTACMFSEKPEQAIHAVAKSGNVDQMKALLQK